MMAADNTAAAKPAEWLALNAMQDWRPLIMWGSILESKLLCE